MNYDSLKFKYRGKDYEIVPISKYKFFITGWYHNKLQIGPENLNEWIVIVQYSEKLNIWFEEFINTAYLESFNRVFEIDIVTMNEDYYESIHEVMDVVQGFTKKAVNVYGKYLKSIDKKINK